MSLVERLMLKLSVFGVEFRAEGVDDSSWINDSRLRRSWKADISGLELDLQQMYRAETKEGFTMEDTPKDASLTVEDIELYKGEDSLFSIEYFPSSRRGRIRIRNQPAEFNENIPTDEWGLYAAVMCTLLPYLKKE